MLKPSTSRSAFYGIASSVFRHKKKASAVLIAAVCGSLLLVFLSSREYRSQAKLFVRLGRENAVIDPTAALGQSAIVAVPQSREMEINSVADILQSRTLLEKTVDRLGPTYVLGAASLDSPPENATTNAARGGGNDIEVAHSGWPNWLSLGGTLDARERAILLLSKKVRIGAAKKSSVFDIVYEGPSPEQCQTVVRTFVDLFLDEHVRLNRTQGTYQFLAGQTDRLRQRLAQKVAELRDLKNDTGVVSPVEQRHTLVARLGRMDDELLTTETARVTAVARVKGLQHKAASLPATQVAETTGFNDEGTDRMRDQFYALRVREKEAQAKYTEAHPRMQHLRDQVSTAQAALNDETRRRTQITKEPSQPYQQAQLNLLNEEPALAALQAQAGQIRSDRSGVRKELNEFNTNEVKVAWLEREVDLLEKDYRKYAASLEQARVDEQLEARRMSNIGIVQEASYEPRPIRPKWPAILLLGFVVGLCGAVALPVLLDRFDDSLRTSDELEATLNLPALATISRMKPVQLGTNGKRSTS